LVETAPGLSQIINFGSFSRVPKTSISFLDLISVDQKLTEAIKKYVLAGVSLLSVGVGYIFRPKIFLIFFAFFIFLWLQTANIFQPNL
jgi:hypothetical protein